MATDAYDTLVYIRWGGTVTLRRRGRQHTYPNTTNFRVPESRAREIAKESIEQGAKFVRVTLTDGRVFCWSPERHWWQKTTR